MRKACKLTYGGKNSGSKEDGLTIAPVWFRHGDISDGWHSTVGSLHNLFNELLQLIIWKISQKKC